MGVHESAFDPSDDDNEGDCKGMCTWSPYIINSINQYLSKRRKSSMVVVDELD